MGTLPPVVLDLIANGSKLSAGLDKAQADIDKMAKNGATSFEKFSATAQKVGTAVGAGMTALGALLFNVSDEMNDAQASLQVAIQNTGRDFKDYQAEIAKTVKSEENFGHTSADTNTALATLTTALGDPKKALDDMALATDLAAFKHISLAGAADKLVKAHAGSSKVFKEFGINLADYGTGADAADKALAALAVRIKGQAAAQVDTIDVIKAKLTDFVATIGSKIAPALQAGGPLIMGLSQVPVAFGAVNKAMMALNPTMLAVGAAVVVLGAVFLAFSQNQERAKKRADDLKKSMDELGLSAEAAAKQKIVSYVAATKGAETAMAKAGVSAEDLTSAIGGNRQAYDSVIDRLERYRRLSESKGDTQGALDALLLTKNLQEQQRAQSDVNTEAARAADVAAKQAAINAQLAASQTGVTETQTQAQQVESMLTKNAAEHADMETYLAQKLDAQKKAEEAATQAVADRKRGEEGLHQALLQKFADADAAVLKDLAMTNADVAVRQGQRDLKTALDDVKKAHNDGGKASDEFILKQTAVVANVLEATKAYAAQKGAQDGSAESAELQIQKLQEEKEAFGTNYPIVRQEIDKQIESLQALANAARIAHIEMQNAGATVPGFEKVINVGGANLRAAGGPVTGGAPYIVGEVGPELFVPNTSGTIIPNNKLGGSMVFSPTINISGAGHDGASLANQVVDALSAWVRANGPLPSRLVSTRN